MNDADRKLGEQMAQMHISGLIEVGVLSPDARRDCPRYEKCEEGVAECHCLAAMSHPKGTE